MLKKSTLREIRTSLARYLAIFAIVALGVGFFSGLKDCKASMTSTARKYLKEHNFYDYMIASSYGIDDESVRIAEGWDGVSGAEGSIQIDVLTVSGDGDAEALKAISLPDKINTLRVAEGRLPESADECVVDSYSITDEGFSIGDTIVLTDENDKDTLKNFRKKEFRIVGTVNTPIYMDYQRGSTDIGNGNLSTFFFVQKDVFDVDYYTNLYVTLKGDEEPFSDEMKAKLDSSEDSMEDLAEAVTAARRETARKEAQDELDEKKQEYEENLAKYEDEKAKAEREIDKAEDKLDKGEKKLNTARKDLKKTIADLNSTIADLESKKTELTGNIAAMQSGRAKAEAGLAQANAGKAQLEPAIAGLKQQLEALDPADPAYEATKAAIEGQLAEMSGKLAEAENQIAYLTGEISKVDALLAQAQAGLAQVEAGLVQARDGLSQAEAGQKEIGKQEKTIEKGRKTLAKEEARADSEFEKARKELDDAKDKLDEAQDKIDEMETGNSYAFSREDNAGYSSFDSNSSIVSNIAKIFPVFFFLIAALVCMTTMTRMVDEQRTQIGVLKALGYSNSQIVGKYMFYSGSAAFMGALTGFFIGCKVFPAVIWNAYTMMYDFSDTVDYIIDPKLGLISLAAALLCSMGATWVSISQDFKVSPSDLIRPKTPPAGKRILLERITPLWKRISFLYKVSIRNIFRDKKRFLMMVIGVSGCTALLIAGMGIRTSIARVADHQFNEISLYDFTAIFSKNMNEERQEDFFEEVPGLGRDEVKFLHRSEVTLKTDSGNYDITCTASDPDDFGRYIDLHEGDTAIGFPGEGEAVIVRKVNHDYGVNIGDTLTVREGYREMQVTVSGICDNYVQDNIYMSLDTYEKGFGKKADIKSALVRLNGETDEDAIRDISTKAANYENAAAVSVNLDVKENVSKMMKSLDAVVYVVILSAALLAFIVLYNLTNINITERIREIATIKVLGFNQLEVSQYVFRENIFLTAIAAVVGIPLGKWLLKFVIDNIVVKMIYFEPRLNNIDIILSVILTFVFAGIVNLAMQKRLRNVSMTESLKSVE
ncbi:MAG: FtsX-like permease family protein [Mogibacterium sp.]|nr:FtsX-like permease family protein [Mogibacterium sp.]